MASTKRRPTAKKPAPEDFNQAAFRIVQEATREKPKATKKKPGR